MSGSTKIPQVFVSQNVAGPALASFTTFTRMIKDEDVVSIGPPFLAAGAIFDFDFLLNVGNVVTAVPTFQFQLKIGTQIVWQSDALPTKATVSAALPAELHIRLRLDSVGKTTAAKFIGSGRFQGAAFNPTFGMLQAASLAVGTGFGSTADDGSVNLDWGAVCSASNASNTIQVMAYTCVCPWYP